MGSLSYCVLALATASLVVVNAALVHPGYLKDHAQTRGFMLGRPVAPMPTPDGKSVLFLRAEPRSAILSLFEFNCATGETRELLSPQRLLGGANENISAEEKARRERLRVSTAGFTGFQLSPSGQQILLSLSGKLYLFNRATDEVNELEKLAGALDAKFSPDGKSIACVQDYDVRLLELSTGKVTEVTKGGSETKPNGLAEFIAQEEMGRHSGYWWSPDSRRIAFQANDSSAVERWHVADPAKPGQPPHSFPYPRPGKANVDVQLGVVAVRGGKTTWIQWDRARYPYLATVSWPSDAPQAPLTLCVQSRDQRELVILEADPKTGRTRSLHVERDAAWVNLDQQMPRWLGDGAAFLWTSDREAGTTLELRSKTGSLIRTIVEPILGYKNLAHFDSQRNEVVFTAYADPTQTHLYRVSIEGGEPQRLTADVGHHTATFGKSSEIYVQSDSSLHQLPSLSVMNRDGSKVALLPEVAEEPPFDGRAEILKIGPDPGFFAEVVRPSAFKPGQK